MEFYSNDYEMISKVIYSMLIKAQAALLDMPKSENSIDILNRNNQLSTCVGKLPFF